MHDFDEQKCCGFDQEFIMGTLVNILNLLIATHTKIYVQKSYMIWSSILFSSKSAHLQSQLQDQGATQKMIL